MSRSRRNTFLTDKQIEVLKLRSRGFTQREIAKIMSSSRENISTIERRAFNKLLKALSTLEAYIEILSISQVEISEGTSVKEATEKIFREANRSGVKLKETMPRLMDLIIRFSGADIESDKIKNSLRVFILRSGSVGIISIPRRIKRSRTICMGIYMAPRDHCS
ncbi:MAG: Tfx family DNA-binding protein [Sulfolobales archaeon]